MDKPASKLKLKLTIKPKPKQPAKDLDLDLDLDLLLDFPMHDLRKDAGLLSIAEFEVPAINDGILKMLTELIDLTMRLKAGAESKDRVAYGHKITSFTKGRDAIRGYTKQITSGSQARKEIPGVGDGIAKRIDEFLKTGTLAEFQLQHQVDPEAKIILELTSVTGIGEVKARSLMEDHGVKSVQDLIDKYRAGTIRVATNQLTHHIAVGLDFYHDLELRMPWSEADQIAKRVTQLIHTLDEHLTVTVCGSYRRKRATCGDIDVLVSNPRDNDEKEVLSKIVSLLEQNGLLIGHLTTHGGTKYMGVCRAAPALPGRRIDIRFVSHDSLGAAILYFTGSGKFNKLMRFRANQRGYTLNEYGLFHYINEVKGSQIPTPTEQDVFRILRFVYLEPEQREF